MRLEKAVQRQASKLIKDRGCHSSALLPQRGNQQWTQGLGTHYPINFTQLSFREASPLAGLDSEVHPLPPLSIPLPCASGFLRDKTLKSHFKFRYSKRQKTCCATQMLLELGAGTIMPAFSEFAPLSFGFLFCSTFSFKDFGLESQLWL